MISNKEKTVIIVLGMHRSGTSAITRSLKALGIDLGNNLMDEAERNNPKGFWEDVDINNLNIDLLNALGYDWHTITPISKIELTSPTAESFKLRAVTLLREKLKNTTMFGLKDPRICRLLPFWKTVFEHLAINVRYIIASRNPMSIVRSLNKRDGFDFTKGYYLWLDHIIHSIDKTSDTLRIVVDYDLLIESPEEQLKRIADFLGINFDLESKDLLEYKKDFLESSLRNTQFTQEDLLLEPSAPKLAIQIYHLLYKVSKDEISLESPEVKLMVDNYINFHQTHLSILKYIGKIEKEKTTYEKIIEEKNKDLNITASQLSDAKNNIEEKNKDLKKLASQLSDAENSINHLNIRLSEFKSKSLETSLTLEAKERLIEEKDKKIKSQDSSLNEIYNSTSWKLSKPIRLLGGLKIKKNISILVKSILENGLLQTIRKTIRIYRREGLDGIKLRLKSISYNSKKDLENSFNNSSYSLKKINWLDETRKINIDEYDIISFDVFDTAIIRLFESPTDIFKYIEENRNIENFSKKRIHSEHKAREIYSDKKDITLDEIYSNLDINSKIELESELLFTSANPAIYDLYSRAILSNKKIYFVSDMYLSNNHIKNILNTNGYTKYDELYVSSIDNLPKGDGSRFIALKEKVGKQKILHIGDNAIADFEWPQKLGINAIKYHNPDDFFSNDALIGPMYRKIKSKESLYLSFVLGLYRKWKYGDKSTGWSSWRDIGFLFGGPLIYNFAKYIKENSEKENKLYFLARDGMIIKYIYDEFFKPSDQITSYLQTSRRAMTFPLFSMSKEQCIVSNQLELYSAIQPSSTADEIFERIAYPELQEIFLDLTNSASQHNIISNKTVKNILNKNHGLLNSKAKIETQGLINYLEDIRFFDSPATLIDVGWNGTIQDSLIKILEITNKKQKIDGIYLGVSPNANSATDKKGYIFDPKNKKDFKNVSLYLDFIELLTSAPDAGLLKYTTEKPFLEFVKPCKLEQQRIDISKEIQHGIIDYAKQLQDFKKSDLPIFLVDEFINFFDILRSSADSNIISLFNSVKHSRMPSSSYSHSIIEFD